IHDSRFTIHDSRFTIHDSRFTAIKPSTLPAQSRLQAVDDLGDRRRFTLRAHFARTLSAGGDRDHYLPRRHVGTTRAATAAAEHAAEEARLFGRLIGSHHAEAVAVRGIVMALQRADFTVAQRFTDAAIGIVDVVGQDEAVGDGAGRIAHARGGAIGGGAVGAG